MASTIGGVVFNDANANGLRDLGESPLAKQTVFIDSNFNGALDAGEPTSVTDSTGQYSFGNLGPGIYRVRVITPKNWRQTSPTQGFYDITATGLDIHAANDFGLTNTAIVKGNVFNDTNGDGIRQITEQGQAGITVFLDKNNNGKLDKNEKSRLTDANGNYRFPGLTPGVYYIRVVAPKGVTVTAPASGVFRVKLAHGQSLSNRNFGIA